MAKGCDKDREEGGLQKRSEAVQRHSPEEACVWVSRGQREKRDEIVYIPICFGPNDGPREKKGKKSKKE